MVKETNREVMHNHEIILDVYILRASHGHGYSNVYLDDSSLKYRMNLSMRPVFQSYCAYTPWLDDINKEFFNRDNLI